MEEELLDDYVNVDVDVDELSEGFKLIGSFPNIVPISENTSVSDAISLQEKVQNAIGSRLAVFGRLLNLVARGSSIDRKSTRLNSSHIPLSRMPSSA